MIVSKGKPEKANISWAKSSGEHKMIVSKDKPEKAGIYWARTSGDYRWYNLIIEIHGDSPYLQYTCFNRITENIDKGVDPYEYYFGPEIGQIKVPKSEIETD